MSPHPIVPALPVLTEEAVWPEFAAALASIGPTWQAPSGRSYRLELTGHRLQVSLELDPATPAPPPAAADIDGDLFELACAVQDAVGGEWSGAALRKSAAIFGWPERESQDVG